VPPLSVAAGGRGAGPTARRVAILLVACAVLSVGVGYAGAQLGLAERGFGGLLEQIGLRNPTSQRPRAPQVPAHAAIQPLTHKVGTVLAASREVTPTPRLLERRPAAIQPAAGGAKPEARASAVGSRGETRASTPPMHKHARIKAAGQTRTVRPPVSRLRGAGATTVALASSSGANRASFTSSTSGTISEPAPAPQALPSGPAGAGLEAPTQIVAPESASRLFERANRARHRGLSGEARVLYAELRAHYPDSAEARLSQALVARLQLDQGELDAALSSFDAYLNGSDRALHEEAMVGRVRALSRLGRSRDAAAAAQSLLKAHPRSAFAEEAEALIERVERD
jgi:hypothetical protein